MENQYDKCRIRSHTGTSLWGQEQISVAHLEVWPVSSRGQSRREAGTRPVALLQSGLWAWMNTDIISTVNCN